MSRQHTPAERIELYLPDHGPEPSPLEAELQPADPTEQASDRQHLQAQFDRLHQA
jgi:hypothetical protein